MNKQTMTRQELHASATHGCEACGDEDAGDHHEELVLAARCHVGEGTTTVYDIARRVLEVRCRKCGAHVIGIELGDAVAH